MTRTDRILIFLLGCITARIFIIYLAKNAGPTFKQILGFIALFISIGLLYQFFINPHRPGAFGGESWWNNLRPLHAMLYLLFGLMAIQNSEYAYIVLVLDLMIGIIGFCHHYMV